VFDKAYVLIIKSIMPCYHYNVRLHKKEIKQE